MNKFTEKIFKKNRNELNRIYLGVDKEDGTDFYINIESNPMILIAGDDEKQHSHISKIIRQNVLTRYFDSKIKLEAYVENQNQNSLFENFDKEKSNMSLELFLEEIEADMLKKLELLKEQRVMRIKEYNEANDNSMERRVIIINGLEKYAYNKKIMKKFEKLSYARVVGITIIGIENTKFLNNKEMKPDNSGDSKDAIFMMNNIFHTKILTKIKNMPPYHFVLNIKRFLSWENGSNKIKKGEFLFVSNDTKVITIPKIKDYVDINELKDEWLKDETYLQSMLLSENAKEPTKISPQKSGFEIYVSEKITIPPHETAIVPTDVVINVPYGYEGEVRPRYTINAETKLRVNTVFVNATDKEPINIITDNIGNETITIEQGKCLAELVIKPVSYMENITVGSF